MSGRISFFLNSFSALNKCSIMSQIKKSKINKLNIHGSVHRSITQYK